MTILERSPQVALREDPDVGEALERMLADESIEVLRETEMLRVEGRSGEGVRIALRTGTRERSIEGSDLLVATGRTPNTDGIGLEVAGIELDARGYFRVNDRLETSARDVWAIGECAGSPQYTHVSFDDFRIIRDNLAGRNRTTRDRLVAFCMFTDPPLARVGLNEREAQRRNLRFRVAKLPVSAVLRTWTTAERRGFMKALVSAEDDRTLGFTMFGADAGEAWPSCRRRCWRGCRTRACAMRFTHIRRWRKV